MSLRLFNGIAVLVVLATHSASAQGVIYSYDSAGHLMKANYGAAGTVTYTYDNAGRLIARTPSTGGGAAWTVSETHISNFSAAQPIGFFTVTVSNTQGSAPTSGTVTVTETPASNETSFSLAGPNWNCSANTCTRSDVLAAGSSYPPITVTVSLAADSSTQVSNQVTVSGGGLAQASVTDVAAIIPALTDIPAGDSFFVPAIDLLRESGITSGCAVNAYCETDTVTQGQMAVFVVRSVMGADNFTYTANPYFTDVPPTYIFFKWIQKMQDLGIAVPCSQTQFCPEQAMTRGLMAILIIRGRYGLPNPPNVPATPIFTDVLSTDPLFPFIQKMSQVGITAGCAVGMYCPGQSVTRGQMAVFIIKGMFNLLLPAGTPILSVAPASILTGQSVPVTIQAQYTNFASGVTQVSAGPGITVSNVTVVNATTLTAQFAAAGNATVGPRSILVTTGGQEATLPNVFQVTSPQ